MRHCCLHILTDSVVGLAVGGAGFYLWRLSQGSEVVWDRHGDWRPWDKVSFLVLF
jgi:hypothetical protein